MKCLTFIAVLATLVIPAAVCRADVPALDHVMVVIMENHSYDQVRVKTYTASLIADYSACTQSYAVTHPSLPNYLALWAGSTFGVNNDNCPSPGSPYYTENLGHACEAAGKTWRSYCEDLPSAGSAVCSYSGYERKHAPWTDFGNLNHSNERPLSDLATDISAGHLPTLSFVVPNQCNSTHDCSLSTGDAWLAARVPGWLDALGPKGVLILTWDEDDDVSGNHILTVFAGATVKNGFSHTGTMNHYNVVRTICDALGLAYAGAAASATPVDDVWAPLIPVKKKTLGSVKAIYR
ncbi:MAG TPA: alkaline phosphatase family protein [Candidatus Krumholzibacteria bacterium]|nr:alkaline phosphatase family protein [Candidatus Krumholzibacteria bacterium]